MKNYYVLMIDIVKSRRLDDQKRYDVQEKLDKAILIANKIFNQEIVKPLNFSAGDSVQGLFDTVTSAYNAYSFIKHAVFPHGIRAGIGYGNVNLIMIEMFDDDDSNKYDGKAYHLARKAIEKVKKEKVNLIIETEKPYDKFVNPIIDDDGIVFMTLSRKAIYSLINLIDPIVDKNYKHEFNYFDTISPIIEGIVNYYRSKSRAREKRSAAGIFHSENNNPTTLNINEVNQYLKEYYDDYKEYKNINGFSAISSPIRSLLVKLTGTKEQNVNALIRGSNMDYLRTRENAKISILKDFYRREL